MHFYIKTVGEPQRCPVRQPKHLGGNLNSCSTQGTQNTLTNYFHVLKISANSGHFVVDACKIDSGHFVVDACKIDSGHFVVDACTIDSGHFVVDACTIDSGHFVVGILHT
jgi:hypothetical protein